VTRKKETKSKKVEQASVLEAKAKELKFEAWGDV